MYNIHEIHNKLQELDSSQCEADFLRERILKGCPPLILVFFLGRFSGVWCIYIECKQEQEFHWTEKADTRVGGF